MKGIAIVVALLLCSNVVAKWPEADSISFGMITFAVSALVSVDSKVAEQYLRTGIDEVEPTDSDMRELIKYMRTAASEMATSLGESGVMAKACETNASEATIQEGMKKWDKLFEKVTRIKYENSQENLDPRIGGMLKEVVKNLKRSVPYNPNANNDNARALLSAVCQEAS